MRYTIDTTHKCRVKTTSNMDDKKYTARAVSHEQNVPVYFWLQQSWFCIDFYNLASLKTGINTLQKITKLHLNCICTLYLGKLKKVDRLLRCFRRTSFIVNFTKLFNIYFFLFPILSRFVR